MKFIRGQAVKLHGLILKIKDWRLHKEAVLKSFLRHIV